MYVCCRVGDTVRNVRRKLPSTETWLPQPRNMQHSLPRWHMKDISHAYFYQLGPSGPSWSSSRNVCLCVCLSDVPSRIFFLGLSLALRLSQGQPGSRPLAWSTRQQTVGRINQAADPWQDQPGSRPLAGSTRQQMEMKMKIKIKIKIKMKIKCY